MPPTIANQFTVLKTLGVGATAQVFLVEENQSKQQFACKVMKTGPNGISQQQLTDV